MATKPEQLRKLVDTLRPRSPKEVMGEAANSSLLGSTITATLATAALLFGMTGIVYALGGTPDNKSTKSAPRPAPVESSAVPAPTDPVVETRQESAAANQTQQVDPESAIEAMGIGDTKDADTQPESLENRLNDLLDGLE